MLNAVWFVLGGMAIVFATLALLAAAMLALQRWVEPRGRATTGSKAHRG